MRASALIAGALLVLTACGQSPPSPAPELAVLSDREGGTGSGHTLVRTTTGRNLAELPPGHLAVALNGGGDIAEAYLVRAAGEGSEIDVLQAEVGYAMRPSAVVRGRPVAAVLVPAALTSFVGRSDVLVVLTDAGRLAGFQHGTPLWQESASPAARLRQFGDLVVYQDGNGWAPVAPADGVRGVIAPAGSCAPGPVAFFGDRPLLDCGGTLSGSLAVIPAIPPATVRVAGGAVLLFVAPEVWRAGLNSARRLTTGLRATAAPVGSPDGRAVYVPTAGGVESLDPASGSHRRLVAAAGISSIAVSRDGNYLYAISGGRFSTFAIASGSRVSSFPTDRELIELVAGG